MTGLYRHPPRPQAAVPDPTNLTLPITEQSGSFTADAVLKKEASASFSADAVLRVARSASFTLDAVIRRTISFPTAEDRFGGSESGTWGSADAGGTWAPDNANLSVAGGAGVVSITYPTGLSGITLSAVSALTIDALVKVKVDDVPAVTESRSFFLGVRLGATIIDGYQARLDMGEPGANSLNIHLYSGASELGGQALSAREGDPVVDTYYNIRLQVFGASPTTIRARAWKQGNPEPAGWDLDTTDSDSNYQDAGSVGLGITGGGTGTVVHSFDDFLVNALTADAILRKTQSASFTMDAVIRKTMQPYRGLVIGNGPMHYWRFGESSGTTAEAEVGTDGTYFETPTLGVASALIGDANTAVRFTAASFEYMAVPAAGPGNVFTLLVWVKRASTGAKMGLFSGHPGSWYFYFDDTNQLVLDNQTIANVLTSVSAFTDTSDWHLVAVTKNGATSAMYYDGVPISTTGADQTLSAPTDFEIGRKTDATSYMDGSLDEPAIFATALSAAQIKELYITGRGGITGFTADSILRRTVKRETYPSAVLTSGPSAYWRLGETGGTTAEDEIGTADGTYVNTPTLGVANGLEEDPNTAVLFTRASSEYISVPTMPAVVDSLTYECWVKRTQSTDLMVLMQGSAQLYIGGSPNFRVVFDKVGVGNIRETIDYGSIADTGSWHHIVATKSGSDAHIYIDGVEASYASSGSPTLDSTTSLFIASQGGSAHFLDGSLDEVAVYDRALTPLEVLDHFRAGNPYVNAVLRQSPVAYWRLGEASGGTAFAMRGTNGAYNNTPTLGVTGALYRDNDFAMQIAAASFERMRVAAVDLTATDNFTVEAWAKINSTATDQVVVGVGEGGTGYSIWIDNGFPRGLTGAGGGMTDAGAAPISTGEWHHIVLRRASGINSVWVDGAQYDPGTANTSVGSTPTGGVQAGAHDGLYFLDGSIDEVALYATALTDAEIKEHYDLGALQTLLTLDAYFSRTEVRTFTADAVIRRTQSATFAADSILKKTIKRETYPSAVLSNSPKGYWRFGEASGNPQDSSGNAHHVTSIGGTPSYGQLNGLEEDPVTAIYIPGTAGERFEIPYTADLHPTPNLSVELWFKRASTGTHMLFSNGASDSEIYFRGDNHTINWGQQGVAEWAHSSVQVEDTSWHHLVCTKDATAPHIYVDGVDVTVVNAPTTPVDSGTSTTSIGARQDGAFSCDVTLGDVAVYNTVLTHLDVLDHFRAGNPYVNAVMRQSPIGYWRMGEASGDVFDLTGHGHTGADSGTPSYGATGALYRDADKAITFSGDDGFLAPQSAGLEPASALSLEAWVKFTGSAATNYTVIRSNADGSGYWLRRPNFGSDILEFRVNSSVAGTVFTGALNDGLYHHVVGTWDGVTQSVYVDGALSSSDITATGTITYGTDGVGIGVAGNGASEPWVGDLDEVALYGHALSAVEVKEHYDLGKLQTLLTLDAAISILRTGSFTADAVLKATISATFTADAVLRRTQSASFTLDAAFARVITATFTADAVLKATITATFTADAVLRKTQSASFTLDAVIRREQTATFVADAVILRNQTATFTADAVILRTISATFTADAVISRERTGSITADAVIFRTQLASFTADAVLQKFNQTFSFTLDAVISTSAPTLFLLDAVIKRPDQTATFTADAMFYVVRTASFTLDAVIRRTDTHTYTADAVVRRTQSATLTADAVIRATLTAVITANAVIRKTVSASITADAVILLTRTGGFVADAVLLSPRTASLTANAVIRRERTGSLTADAIIRRTSTATFTIDAYVANAIAASFTLDAVLNVTQTASLTADAVLAATGTASFTLDAFLAEAEDHVAVHGTVAYDRIHSVLGPAPEVIPDPISSVLGYDRIHSEVQIGD